MIDNREKKLKIYSRLQSRTGRSGLYHVYTPYNSGSGDFTGTRPYVPGDPIRFIDWNVSARTQHTHTKQFSDEKNRKILLLIDNSSSLCFPNAQQKHYARDVAALISRAAVQAGDSVSIMLFSEGLEMHTPFLSSTPAIRHALKAIGHDHERRSRGGNINNALQKAQQSLGKGREKALIFILSDFLFRMVNNTPLKRLSYIHDTIGLWIQNKEDFELPKQRGIIQFSDPETKRKVLIDSQDKRVRKRYENAIKKHIMHIQKSFQDARTDYVPLPVDCDPLPILFRFFQRRQKEHQAC